MNQDNTALQKRMELVFLFDFYGALLKDSPREMLEAYICDDCSLSEIAAIQGITRQGVHDAIKRASGQLYQYEEKLGLVEKFHAHKDIAKQIAALVSELEAPEYQGQLEQIMELTTRLAEE